MKRLAALSVLTAIASAGMAQNADYTPVDLSVRLGIAYSTNDVTRSLAKQFIGIGIDYEVNNLLFKTGGTYVSVDWLGKSGSGGKGNIFPILLNQRFSFAASSEERMQPYGFIGLGIAIIDVTTSKTELAARAGFGVRLGEHMFTEIQYLVSGAADGAKADNIALYLGYRF